MRNANRTILIAMMFCMVSVAAQVLGGPTNEDAGGGVTDANAAELVRAARENENWIHRVDSFLVRIEYKWTKSPEGIAEDRAELRAEYPDSDLDPNWFPRLKPSWTEKLEYAFDKKRLRFFQEESGRHLDPKATLKIWDGKNGTIRSQCPWHNLKKKEHGSHESYTLLRTPQDRSLGYGLFFPIAWLRTQPHSFWWWPMDFEKEEEAFGRLQDFVVTGRANYRGIDCYVLETKHKPPGVNVFFRWYVGVEDRRLYGNCWIGEPGTEPRYEFWTLDYNEVAPGCWLPMTQGRIRYDRDSSGKRFWQYRSDLKVVEVRVNDKLPDKLFQMHFKEGVDVYDERFEAPVWYPYKANRTDAEWKQIREQSRKRAQEDAGQKNFRDALVGKPAPPFPKNATWLNSRPLTWQNLRGKVVILDFCAVWCGPCRDEMPRLSRLHKKREETGIIVIGIHTPGSRLEDIRKFMKEHALGYPICIDKTSSDEGFGTMSGKCGERGIPYAVLVDQQGNIAACGESGGSVTHLLKKADELLKNKPEARGLSPGGA